MAELIAVTAVRPLIYRGRHVSAGETFAVPPVEALALTYQKRATFAQPLTRYRTAALTHETPSVPGASQHAASPLTTPKRRYRRRDLTPEA